MPPAGAWRPCRAPPAATQGAGSIELRQFSAPDGGAKGLVPADPSWNISSNQGTIEGSSDVGNFVFGVTIQVITPENSMGAGGISAPYSDAAASLGTILPQLVKGVSNVQVTSTVADGVIDSYTSSGMYAYTYDWNGQPWTGVAIVATDDPSKYGNFMWNWYFTNIAVPAGSDGSVGSGLLKAWQAWDPSGAIAKRSQRSKQLLDETNQIWQDTSEFRSKQADRQSRDVGCLLQGIRAVVDLIGFFEDEAHRVLEDAERFVEVVAELFEFRLEGHVQRVADVEFRQAIEAGAEIDDHALEVLGLGDLGRQPGAAFFFEHGLLFPGFFLHPDLVQTGFAEHGDGSGHRADFIFAAGIRDRCVIVALGQTVHIGTELRKRGHGTPAENIEAGDKQDECRA